MSRLRAFLLTDIVGSTRATIADAVAMRALLGDHDEALVQAVVGSGGRVFKHTGDGICAVFDDPVDALVAAVASQRALVGLGLGVRMGVDVGVAHERGDDYVGLTLHRCARVMGVAHGGQILTTLATEELVRDALPPDLWLLELGPVRLRDFDDDVRLFQVTAPELRERFPPLRAGRAAKRFPQVRSALHGRSRELAELDELIGTGRLVTLVGAGGSGKTRLALEVLVKRHEAFGGGAFADLSTFTDPELVASTVADAVGMPFGETVDHGDVVAFLAERPVLLVVDNCEHVLDAVAELCDDILDGCHRVALLCTSREPVAVDGERVVRLQPLALPDAAALFVDRANRAGVRLTGRGERELIEDICTRLDRMPLAIELVAAQTSHLSLVDVRALLDERFELRIHGGRAVVARHETIEAALAWSHDRLEAGEQALLRQVSVFAASFTLGDAAAVGGLTSAATAAEVLGSLVDKSLVVLDDSGRYHLLELVRSFATARAVDAGERDAVLARLQHHLVAQAPGPWSPWFAMRPSSEPATDIDNMRPVLEWCVASGHPEAAAALTAANLLPWFVTGRTSEALGWLTIPAELDAALPLDERLAHRVAAAWLAFPAQDRDGMLAIDAHLALAPADHPARAPLLFLKAWSLLWNDRDTARRLLASVLAHGADDHRWRDQCTHLEGHILLLDDRPAEAAAHFSSLAAPNRSTAVLPSSIGLAIACHLDGRHDQVSAIVAALDVDHREHRGYFSGPLLGLAAIIEATGRGDVPAARGALADLLDHTAATYPHLPTAAGFAVQAAAVVAHCSGRPADAIALLSGSRRHFLHRRYEGATALGRRCLQQSRALMAPDQVHAAAERGASMTIEELVSLARLVADGGGPTQARPTTQPRS